VSVGFLLLREPVVTFFGSLVAALLNFIGICGVLAAVVCLLLLSCAVVSVWLFHDS